MKRITQKRLEALLAEWQPRLGLADWEIRIRLCTATEMGGNAALGLCEHNLKRRVATIKVLAPQDWPRGDSETDEEIADEIEDTVIHECLHCHFAPFEASDSDSPQGIAQEQAIDALARAFVRTKRLATRKRCAPKHDKRKRA